MATTHSFNRPYEMVDYTDELLLIPNQWGLLNTLGIFGSKGVAQNTVTFDKTTRTLGLLEDTVRGERVRWNKGQTSQLHSFVIPHFTLDDAILPEDLQDKRKIGTADQAASLDDARMVKMERIRKSHAATIEFAKAKALQGLAYAPNGTVSYNYYTEFGVAKKQVAFDTANASADQITKNEEVIAHIQDTTQTGAIISDIVVICSPEFFAGYIANAGVKEAYSMYASSQEPLRNRLGTGLHRTFPHGGLTFIEYRGSFDGQRIIPANRAYAVPLGMAEEFLTIHGPAHHLDYVNTAGRESYVFEYADPKGRRWDLESETNTLVLPRRPELIVELTQLASFA